MSELIKLKVSDAYARLVEAGTIEHDLSQVRLVELFDELNIALSNHQLASKSSALGWLFGRRTAPDPIKGLYIWGSVGRGKTMLMDLFFQSCSVKRKRRVHFHDFMRDVHGRIHAHRQALKAGKVKESDPIPPVAAAIADEAQLLCFDEFTVRDVADAMILRRLFSALFEARVIVVATSNVAPDDLYEDGLQRADFLPFVEVLKHHVAVYCLDARTDFRLEKLGRGIVYSYPLGEVSDARFEGAWNTFLGGADAQSAVLRVQGRDVIVPLAALGAARFSFDDLCLKPLGAADYLTISQCYHTIFISHVPDFEATQRNEAKRFILLIDTLYDANVKLVVSADADALTLGKSLIGVEGFEFERTRSRLYEMQSDTYLALPHQASLK